MGNAPASLAQSLKFRKGLVGRAVLAHDDGRFKPARLYV
jgi:hypothetical protein